MGMGFGRVTTSEHAGRARRFLIINADGYGMTPGITRAIEQCIDFGTVRSLSANVNFTHAEALADLVRRQSDLSIGCHMNPVVGPPVLPPHRVGSLLGPDGNFWYRHFARKFLLGKIKTEELRCEMVAQVEKARDLAGAAFSHVDFHMGLHRLPVLYEIFLEVAERSGTGRIRTHRYRVGMESKDARLTHFLKLFAPPTTMPKFAWNVLLRRKALARGFVMPDYRVGIRALGFRANTITVPNYLMLLRNIPRGYSEFTVHPGYLDDELGRWSIYTAPRYEELRVLTSPEFRSALSTSDVQLVGYRQIPRNKFVSTCAAA